MQSDVSPAVARPDRETGLAERGHSLAPARLPAVLLEVLIFALLALALFWPSFFAGIHEGDSFVYNYSWTSAFAAQMSFSDPYPRWLERMWFGSGSADFNFYPPLFFFVAGLAMNIGGVGVLTGQLIAAVVLHAFSGLGTACLARALGIGRIGALAAGVAIMLLPYHLIDWFQRNANAEIAAYPAIAFTLAGFALVIGQGRGYALFAASTAACVMAHILAAPIVAVGCLAILIAHRRTLDLVRFRNALVVGMLGVLAAAVYWLPALALRDTVSAWMLGAFHWSHNLLRMGELFTGSFLGVVYTSALLLTVLALAVLAVGRQGPGRGDAIAQRVVVGIVVAFWFLVSPLSRGLWTYTPLEAMQFPWRFYVLLDVGIALALGIAADRLMVLRAQPWAGRRGVFAGLLLAAGAVSMAYQPAWWRTETYPISNLEAQEGHFGPDEWLDYGEHSYDFYEGGLAEDALLRDMLDGVPVAVTAVQNGAQPVEGMVRMISAAPRALVFEIDCPAACDILVKRGYWRFWEMQGPDGPIEVAASVGHPLIVATVPAGRAEYRLHLPSHPLLYVGGAVSLVAVLALLGLGLRAQRMRAPGRA